MADPGLLFHYQPGRIDWLCRMFVQSEVKLSDPRTFNDPWDCRPTFREMNEYSGVTRRRLVQRYWKEGGVVWSDKFTHETHLQTLCTDAEFEGWLWDVEREYIRQITENWVIYCLSDRPDVHLMWAHYADRHRGLCLGFLRDTPVISEASPVTYAKKLKTLRIGTPDEKAARDAFLTKSEVWRHEREWRALIRRSTTDNPGTSASPGGFCRIDLEGLVSITFGLQFSPWEREAVRQIARAHNWQGTFMEAVKADDEYKIVFRDLPA